MVVVYITMSPCGKSPELSGWRGLATVLAITHNYFFRTRQITDKLESIGERKLSTPERKGFRMCGKVSDFPHEAERFPIFRTERKPFRTCGNLSASRNDDEESAPMMRRLPFSSGSSYSCVRYIYYYPKSNLEVNSSWLERNCADLSKNS
jgi:hypothetical protein